MLSRSFLQRVLLPKHHHLNKFQPKRSFSVDPHVPQEQLEKELASIRMFTYLCFPILAGGAYFVYQAEHAHHEKHKTHLPPPKVPYVGVIAKEFPWAHGDKCTMFDPHCKEKIEGTWPPEQPEEGEGEEEEEGGDDEEGGGDDEKEGGKDEE